MGLRPLTEEEFNEAVANVETPPCEIQELPDGTIVYILTCVAEHLEVSRQI